MDGFVCCLESDLLMWDRLGFDFMNVCAWFVAFVGDWRPVSILVWRLPLFRLSVSGCRVGLVLIFLADLTAYSNVCGLLLLR